MVGLVVVEAHAGLVAVPYLVEGHEVGLVVVLQAHLDVLAFACGPEGDPLVQDLACYEEGVPVEDLGEVHDVAPY